MDFLVLPRIVALGVMMPLLAMYANCVGILGGMAVSFGILSISPTAYWVETQSIVDLSDISTGLFKALAFGLLIGLAGCLRGLQAERSAAGVGKAAKIAFSKRIVSSTAVRSPNLRVTWSRLASVVMIGLPTVP